MILVVNGTAYPIDVDICDRRTAVYQWRGQIPECPRCGSPLWDDTRTARQAAPVEEVDQEVYEVRCDNPECGWRGRTV